MDEQILTYKLLLEASAREVSQPVAMGEATRYQVQVWVESAAATMGGGNLVATAQTSPDLDNWTDTSDTITITQAPGSDTVETPVTAIIGAPYFRLHYAGANVDLLIGASLRLFKD